ncbi:MAG: class I SAM-dependent methyltransferase [Gaiellaceae bacterium]
MDATEFRQRSRAVWEAMAQGWDSRHAYFEEIARPVTDLMLERLAPERRQTILDLAAGTGVAGFAAAGLVGGEGRVIVSDFAEQMVDAAARHAARLGLTNVECRVLDAEQLDVADGAVDGVICRWGYMLMADPAAAFRETRRVLRPGGRFAFAVFTGPDENPWGSLPAAVLVERGHMPPPEAGAPGLFALAGRDRLSGLLAEAGFSQPRFEEVAFTWRFADADAFWTFLNEAAGAITIVLDRLDDDERLHAGQEIRRRVEAFAGPNGVELNAVSLVASVT